MARVKICGITCEKDVEILNKYLPDYAGFIFAKSRRQLTSEAASRLSRKLAVSIRKVGIFVNAQNSYILEAVESVGLDVVQLHGNETPEAIERLRRGLKPGIEIWKAVAVRDEASVQEIGRYAAERYLLDAYVEGSYGGAGKSFNWEYAAAADAGACIILAGGLNCDNVADAIKTVGPFAVDVSSGVETGGVKDEAKVCGFIEAVRKQEVCK